MKTNQTYGDSACSVIVPNVKFIVLDSVRVKGE